MKIEDLKVGDQVVLGSRSTPTNGLYEIATITRLTKTRFIMGNESYMKSSGIRVGDGNEWDAKRIQECERPPRLMTSEEAKEVNKTLGKSPNLRQLKGVTDES